MADFSSALAGVKAGAKISRDGWNAPGQWVVLQQGYPNGIPINANTAAATGIPEGTVCRFRPYLMLHTADGSFVPWAPSVTDVLADDWYGLVPSDLMAGVTDWSVYGYCTPCGATAGQPCRYITGDGSPAEQPGTERPAAHFYRERKLS
ncbi:MAG: DUF2829 domain-containing protein [Hamadaea sp.]|nr:DUF2829 domain-containing protein [Hamadaea sp.]